MRIGFSQLSFAAIFACLTLFPGGSDTTSGTRVPGSISGWEDELPSIRIPNECVIARASDSRDYQDCFAYDTRAEEEMRKKWYSAHCLPYSVETILVDPACTKRLDSLAVESKRQMLMLQDKNLPFAYVASAQRSYCGTSAIPSACEQESPVAGEQFGQLGGGAMPPDLANIGAGLDRGDLKRMPTELESSIELVAITPAAKDVKGLRAYLEPSNGSPRKRRNGIVRYIHTTTPPDIHRPDEMNGAIGVRLSHAMSEFSREWASENKTHWFWSNKDGAKFTRYIFKRAAVLESYWKDGHGLLDAKLSPERAFQSYKLPALDTSSRAQIFDYDEATEKKRHLNALVHSGARLVMSHAAHSLTRATTIDELLSAASFWWAARSAELAMGCDSAINKPFPGAEYLVKNQYSHQTCRRQYANRAFMTLNHAFLRQKNLRLTSPAWTVAVALGSRRERLGLFTRAFEMLEKQIEYANYPEARELSLLAHEIFQALQERDGAKVLTWNGQQPADADDQKGLSDFLARAREFMGYVRLVANDRRWSAPTFYLDAQRLWLLVKRPLELAAWPSDSNEIQPLGEPALPTLIEKLGRLTPKDTKELVALYEVSREFAADDSPGLRSHVLRTWLEFMAKHPSDMPVLHTDVINTEVQLVGLWTRRFETSMSPSPDALDAQCTGGHALSCLTQTLLVPDDEQTAESWVRALATAPYRLSVSKFAFERFKALYEMHIRARSAKERRAWTKAFVTIHKQLRSWAVAQLELPPSTADFAACIDEAQWLQLARGKTSIAQELEIKATCPNEKKAKISRSWGYRFAALKRMAVSRDNIDLAVWEENPISAALRYNTWTFALGKHAHGVIKAWGPDLRKLLKQIRAFEKASQAYFAKEVAPDFWHEVGERFESSTLHRTLQSQLGHWHRCEEDSFVCWSPHIALFVEPLF